MYHIDDVYRVQVQRLHPPTGTEDLPIWLTTGRAVTMTDEQLNFFKLTVTVLAVDIGRSITTKAYNLMAFDEGDVQAIASIEPLAYRVYLPEVVPLDGAYSWNSVTNSKLGSLCTDSLLLQMEGSNAKNTLTGWVLAVSAKDITATTSTTTSTLWLHKVILAKMLNATCSGVYHYTNLATDLIRKELAVPNDCRFSGCDYEAPTKVSALWCANNKKAKKFEEATKEIANDSKDDDESSVEEAFLSSDAEDEYEDQIVNGELADITDDEEEEVEEEGKFSANKGAKKQLLAPVSAYDLYTDDNFIESLDKILLNCNFDNDFN